ncbi:MAG: hypothetical protein GIKADHBN_02383 [Phycisphaerales bacterium]|nr:hypothetical protein [Phycisphaerales bacterium]
MARFWRSALALATAVVTCGLTACSSPHRYPAVPSDIADRAIALNNPAIRSWYLPMHEEFLDEIRRVSVLELKVREEAGQTGPLPTAYYLAISGGGANGAYGAGLLCGWTARGDRPNFKVVTGISTGALTAPFAFLGPAYDDRLKHVYTTVTTDQICTKRGLLSAFYDDALMDTAPLRKLMAELIDEQMMRDIAKEYAKGRLLMVATTNLDANRAVVWNVGAIASSGHPDALGLIHKVLAASAAIPAAFPPVMIDVEVDGKQYQEMHVDGGAKAQVFLYPPTLQLKTSGAAAGMDRQRAAYIIRNSRLDPEWADVERLTLSIAGRAIASMIQTQGVGDLYRIYVITQRDGVAYNLASIPSTFDKKPKEDFDPVYMSALFDVGYQQALTGDPWTHTPPGYIAADAGMDQAAVQHPGGQ